MCRPNPAATLPEGSSGQSASFKPRTVLTTAPFEHHSTHQATTAATVFALRELPPDQRPSLLGFPVWDSLLGDQGVTKVDISKVMDQKLQAVRCHASQMQVRPFDEAVRSRNLLAAVMGEVTGPAAAKFQEEYVDLNALIQEPVIEIRQWLTQRLQDWLTALPGKPHSMSPST